MTTIKQTVSALKQAARRADINGNGTLGTNEIAASLKQKTITKAERDMLTRAAAQAGNTAGGLILANYDTWLDRYGEVAKVADTNRDNTIVTGEARKVANSVRVGTREIYAAQALMKKFAAVQKELNSNVRPQPQPLTLEDIDLLVEMQNAIEQAAIP